MRVHTKVNYVLQHAAPIHDPQGTNESCRDDLRQQRHQQGVGNGIGKRRTSEQQQMRLA
jgi:hypothetical protein